MVTRTLFLHVVPSPLAVTLEITDARPDARGHHRHRLGGIERGHFACTLSLRKNCSSMTHKWRQNQKR